MIVQSSSRSRPKSESDCKKFDGLPRRPDKQALLKVQAEEEQRGISRSLQDEHISREEVGAMRRAIFY